MRLTMLFALILATVTAAPAAEIDLPPEVRAAMDTISASRIRVHLRFLASDLLEGRGTGQRGGDIAAEYLATQLQLAALWPGAPGGSYLQRVPLVGVETMGDSSLGFEGGATPAGTFAWKDDYVLWTDTQKPLVDSDAELVFVGYGIEAPEYGWDDYKGQDVRGKVLLMLVNDPPSEDPAFFGGKALTYYGRWTYKFEVAARKGAVGALLIHTDASAGYGWRVVRSSWGKEQAFAELDPRAPAPLQQAGWMTDAASRRIVASAGRDLDALREAAARADFAPVPLGVRAKAHIVSKVRRIDTANVIAYVPGSDPDLKSEAVIVTAHYDHLGVGEADPNGDGIYNGAYDNASGVAAMLEVARAFRLGTVKPRRTVVFIAAAAEEGGLRGSEYYAKHPTFAPGKIAANFNLDGVSVLGVPEDMSFLGGDRSSLEADIAAASKAFGFTVSPDAHPEQGSFYRSDHFNFARIGVPSVSIKHGQRFAGKEPAWGEEQWKEYNETRYHRPSDEYQPGWDLDGAEMTSRITFYLAYRVAVEDSMPTWKQGDEFEAARKEALSSPAPAGGTR